MLLRLGHRNDANTDQISRATRACSHAVSRHMIRSPVDQLPVDRSIRPAVDPSIFRPAVDKSTIRPAFDLPSIDRYFDLPWKLLGRPVDSLLGRPLEITATDPHLHICTVTGREVSKNPLPSDSTIDRPFVDRFIPRRVDRFREQVTPAPLSPPQAT